MTSQTHSAYSFAKCFHLRTHRELWVQIHFYQKLERGNLDFGEADNKIHMNCCVTYLNFCIMKTQKGAAIKVFFWKFLVFWSLRLNLNFFFCFGNFDFILFLVILIWFYFIFGHFEFGNFEFILVFCILFLIILNLFYFWIYFGFCILFLVILI